MQCPHIIRKLYNCALFDKNGDFDSILFREVTFEKGIVQIMQHYKPECVDTR